MSNEILLGVSGGVAAFKSAALCSMLAQKGYLVSVILTRSAEKFIGTATFAALSGRQVYTSMFDSALPLGPHIELARRANLFVIAPATANVIGKAAHGIADDLLTTTLLSFSGPTLFAPAMNVEMWQKPPVQRNIQQLVEDGIQIIGPGSGWQSCRDQGTGRMSEPDEILSRIKELLP